ncbi:hypothetical protein [Rhodococcus sp. IEGM 1379]|uniref:hypothetical protein n=1 Tax=Rhodococcus sp. IEGM 1379 TaxID=3047086 RepID=UPI0024B7B1D2|nr:hypothetical protein [Rhodococcus sp. IEGM 1379]MDI9918202.1 hypothetical protein [Rhodococcus sp. IEGM 1379]
MSTMMKAMRFVGDLDDDFYRDERQRDVWNEASAVGLQSILWAVFVGSAVLPWVAGRTGAWISLALLITALLGSVITIVYANSLNVDVYALSNYNRPRVVISIVLYLVAAVGIMARLKFDSYQDSSTWVGALVGGIVGGGLAIVGVKLHQLRSKRREAAEEVL